MSANLVELSENLGNLGQNVQYFSQMARLFVAFPEYLGHSNQFATSSWGFSQNSGNSYQNTYICQCKSQKKKLLALTTVMPNAYICV